MRLRQGKIHEPEIPKPQAAAQFRRGDSFRSVILSPAIAGRGTVRKWKVVT
jgi:hypothetical protein